MDKQDERVQFYRVFGPHAKEAEDNERPDFLFADRSGSRLGVEVTSVYANNADAKLNHLPGYSAALIDRTRKVHRADVGHLRVEDATLLNPDGSVVDKVTGIFQEMPSQIQRYELLAATVDEKERKVTEYLQNCSEVDLIVLDGSNLFRHATHEEFYRLFHALATKARLVASPFREIHLITTTSDQKMVYIPLIANTFFADCFAFEHLIKPEIDAGRPSRDVFQLLAACLSCLGYSRVRVTSGAQGVGFFCGAWELLYAEDGKKLRDWVYPCEAYAGETLEATIADAKPEVLDLARELASQRGNWFSTMDVRLPVHET